MGVVRVSRGGGVVGTGMRGLRPNLGLEICMRPARDEGFRTQARAEGVHEVAGMMEVQGVREDGCTRLFRLAGLLTTW